MNPPLTPRAERKFLLRSAGCKGMCALLWGVKGGPVDKNANPTDEEVDRVHAQMLGAFKTLFDTHKDALGWSHKELQII